MSLTFFAKKIGNKILNIKQLFLKPLFGKVPPGHYYSPIPSLSEIKHRRLQIFSKNVNIKGINLRNKEKKNNQPSEA